MVSLSVHPKVFADGKEVIGSVVKGDKAEITLSTSFEGGAIFYTLDGSEPSFETTLYDEPFTVSTRLQGLGRVAYKGRFFRPSRIRPGLH